MSESDEQPQSQATGQVSAEQLVQLRASEARFRAFIEHARDAIVEIDPQAKILYASPRFADICGYPREEIPGKLALDFVHPDDLEVVDELREHAMETETGVEMIFRFRHGSDAWRWLELAGQPFRTPDGELRAVLVARDVTERIRLEQERLAQLELESRIGELSRRLMSIDTENVEGGVQEELEAAAAMGDADRCYLVATMAPREVRTYEWNADGISARGKWFRRDTPRNHMWATRQLLDGKVICVPDIEALPEEARPVRDGLREAGVRSMLLIPVRSGNRLVAMLGFHCVRNAKTWSDHEVYVLQLAAELFVSTLRRRGAEAAYHASENRFRALSENAEDAICETDDEGRFLYANPSFQSLVGYTNDELRAMAPFEMVAASDRRRARQMHQLAARSPGSAGTMIYNIRRRDGSERCMEASGRGFEDANGSLRIVAVIRDVTERERTQRSLERQLELEKQIGVLSRRFLALSMGEIDEGIREGLEAVGRLIDADRCWLLPRQPDAGRFYWSRLPNLHSMERIAELNVEDFPWARALFHTRGALHVPSVDAIPREAGAERREMRVLGIKSFLGIRLDTDHGLIGFMGFEAHRAEREWDDDTLRLLRFAGEMFVSALKRKRAEVELANSQAQLLQSQKMEAVGTLAGGVAHDFNNQLAVILGNARHLLRRVESDLETREALVDLERAAEHCAQLTRSLLAFSRQAPAELQPIDPNRVVMDARELLAPLMPRSIRFSIEHAPDLDPVSADSTQLQQVIVNLAVNARDAMPDGGVLAIHTRNRRIDADAAAELGLTTPGACVEIRVTDTGIGMDERTRSRIFDPFFTTKAPGKGTGLGLATAYGIVQGLGGAIEVESEPGRGTTFRVLLPCSTQKAADPSVPQAPRAGRGSETVLLVEDEESVRRLVSRMLAESGYRVLEATDGIDALRISQDHEGEIEIVVSDLVMPNLSGDELARRLLQSRPEMRVLFISGFAEREPDLAGAGLVPKPFTQPQLLAEVRALLDGAETR